MLFSFFFPKNSKIHSAFTQNKRPSKKQAAQSGNILKTREFSIENTE